jgi:hypothetical protein
MGNQNSYLRRFRRNQPYQTQQYMGPPQMDQQQPPPPQMMMGR